MLYATPDRMSRQNPKMHHTDYKQNNPQPTHQTKVNSSMKSAFAVPPNSNTNREAGVLSTEFHLPASSTSFIRLRTSCGKFESLSFIGRRQFVTNEPSCQFRLLILR